MTHAKIWAALLGKEFLKQGTTWRTYPMCVPSKVFVTTVRWDSLRPWDWSHGVPPILFLQRVSFRWRMELFIMRGGSQQLGSSPMLARVATTAAFCTAGYTTVVVAAGATTNNRIAAVAMSPSALAFFAGGIVRQIANESCQPSGRGGALPFAINPAVSLMRAPSAPLASYVSSAWSSANGRNEIGPATTTLTITISIAGAVCLPRRDRRSRSPHPGYSAGPLNSEFITIGFKRRLAPWSPQSQPLPSCALLASPPKKLPSSQVPLAMLPSLTSRCDRRLPPSHLSSPSPLPFIVKWPRTQ